MQRGSVRSEVNDALPATSSAPLELYWRAHAKVLKELTALKAQQEEIYR